MPALCSPLAALISATMVVTLFTPATTSPMVAPACSTSCVPTPTLATESSIRPLISLAAALRWARLRTSLATTAKPRPCSPARAASTAAFSARMLVWNAMPSITLMMSTILREDWSMEPMVPTTCCTTSPPRTAMSDAARASSSARLALAAFCCTVDVSCSIEAAVSCSALACDSVRADRSPLPAAISEDAVLMESVLSRTCFTRCERLSRMARMACRMLVVSPGSVCTSTARLPSAIWVTTSAAYCGSPPSWCTRLRSICQAISATMSISTAPMDSRMAVLRQKEFSMSST